MVGNKRNIKPMLHLTEIPVSWRPAYFIKYLLYGCIAGFVWLAPSQSAFANPPLDATAEQFKQTWDLARTGKHDAFRQQLSASTQYLLYPYLQYEDYRSRLATVPAAELATFLESHKGWAFSSGLRQAWLRVLGRQQQWQDLLDYSGQYDSIRGAETRCHHLNARLKNNYQKTAKAKFLNDAMKMWLTGSSQHKACDAVFSWLDRRGYINEEALKQRILIAFQANNLTLTNYLKRNLSSSDQAHVNAYQQLWKKPNAGFRSTHKWSDTGRTQDIILAALQAQVRNNPDLALKYWRQVEHRFAWSEQVKSKLLYDIALFSAVALDKDVLDLFKQVPAASIDDRLLQWRLRTALNHQRWDELLASFEAMTAISKQEGRFRYWQALALKERGEKEASQKVLKLLAREATFWGFLAADQLNQDYRICPLDPEANVDEVSEIAAMPGVKRALELRRVGLDDFASREWASATASLSKDKMRSAAALATQNNWSSQAIISLGKSGDTRYYSWRFPLAFEQHVQRNASRHNLDPAWIFGLMRAESALDPRAISPAKAYGLMQLLPSTAKRLSASAGVQYTNKISLLDPASNIAFGSAEMSKLLSRYNDTPAYVTGAYNAGPGAVDRWLKQRPDIELERWLELMPYYETRDYIPRVMAFATLYAWRLGDPVSRVSHRLRHANAATNGAGLAKISCLP